MSASEIKLLKFLQEILAVKYLDRGPSLSAFIPSSTASNSLTVYRDYQFSSSQYLRHIYYSRLFGSPTATTTCTCASELVPVPAGALTPDDHASLVIRVVECIVAHHSIAASQCAREQTSDFHLAR